MPIATLLEEQHFRMYCGAGAQTRVGDFGFGCDIGVETSGMAKHVEQRKAKFLVNI